MSGFLSTTFLIAITGILIGLILLRPYLGVIFTVASLPVIDLLPTIPFLSSFVILIGAVTLVGYFLQRKTERTKQLFNFSSVHLVGLLFIGWIFVSNPLSAWYGANRNWIITFIQCWALLWLAGELIDTEKKHQVFMWIFSIVSAISAIIAIREGRIGETIGTSFRAGGLAGQPNSTARYFVVAMIFFSYLATVTKSRLLRLITIGGVIITFVGVFFTLSRTGIILATLAIGAQIIFNIRKKHIVPVILIYSVSTIGLLFFSDGILNIIKSIMPSIEQGTDTIGIRYQLWQAGWNMWLDNVIRGVGIGMFPQQLRYYALGLRPHYWDLSAHNTYVAVLAETGIVGFCLFIGMLSLSLKNYLKNAKSDDFNQRSLRRVWITVILVILVGSITKTDQYDKLLWFLMGASVYFSGLHNLTLPVKANQPFTIDN